MPFYMVTFSAGDKALFSARVEARGKAHAKAIGMEAMKRQQRGQRIVSGRPVAGEISVAVEKSEMPEWLLKRTSR